MKSIILLNLLLILSINSAPIEDLTILPDYPVPSKIYTGYLKINENNSFFYLYVESQSSPSEDPLVLWLNGGPGCSSLMGFAQEHGPAVFKFLETNFTVNPYSWNKVANMLYLDSPIGVGFNTGYNNEPITDNSSADQNLIAVLAFFEKFPELRSKKFFVTGESYAGVYVPYLAERIIAHNKNSSLEEYINLEGIISGDGVTSDAPGFNFFLIGRDFAPENVVKNYYECKTDPNCNSTLYNNFLNTLTNGSYINPYNVFGPCALVEDQYSGVPCLDFSGPEIYFNRVDVKKALKVPQDIYWYACGSINYVGQGISIQNYPILLENNIRVLVYSGDADSSVPTPYTRNWIRSLNLTAKQGENWRTWGDDDEVLGGFLTEYEEGLTFITVHGSGHMVPQYKPKRAFYFFNKFINNEKI